MEITEARDRFLQARTIRGELEVLKQFAVDFVMNATQRQLSRFILVNRYEALIDAGRGQRIHGQAERLTFGKEFRAGGLSAELDSGEYMTFGWSNDGFALQSQDTDGIILPFQNLSSSAVRNAGMLVLNQAEVLLSKH